MYHVLNTLLDNGVGYLNMLYVFITVGYGQMVEMVGDCRKKTKSTVLT